MASGILVISFVHFPFFFLHFHFFPVINPAREEPQSCDWITGIKQPSQAETHQETDTTAEMVSTHIYSWVFGHSETWRTKSRSSLVISKYSETHCEASVSSCIQSPSNDFSFFFVPKTSGLSCVTGRITNRIWGWGWGSFTLSSCVFFYVTCHRLLCVQMMHLWT